MVRLPSKKDDLYFDGYPRSGNTYFIGLILRLYPGINYSSHLHTIAGIKLALSEKVPTYIIIRKPEDAIVSNLYRKKNDSGNNVSESIVDDFIREYIHYYQFVLKQENKLCVLNFDSLIKNEKLLMEKLVSEAGMEMYEDEKFKELQNENRIIMKNKEKGKDDRVSSLPNPERDEFKKKNIELIMNSKYYPDALNVYQKLVEN